MMDVEKVNGELQGERLGASRVHAERPGSTGTYVHMTSIEKYL